METTFSASFGRKLLAYAGIFIVSAGDAVRYSIGFFAWGTLCVVLAIVATWLFVRSNPRATLERVPLSLYALLAFMLLSTAWSFYPAYTLLGYLGTLVATVFALFLIATYNWRQLLRIIADVMWFILGSSFVFELYAALIVRGPIAPIFKNYKGQVPPSGAYYWTQGTLLHFQRIQGIVGNANLLAYVAMLGFILFTIQLLAQERKRWFNVVGLLMAVAAFVLTRSASIGFAMILTLSLAFVALYSQGKDKEVRHRYYRVTWSVIAVVAAFVLIYRGAVFTVIGKSPDMTGRTDIWKAVMGLIGQRPLQGWGWISYWMPGVKPYEGLIVRDNVTYYEAHNSYLDVWLQLGVFGFVIFIAMLSFTFKRLWRLAVRSNNVLHLWPAMIFIGLLAQNLTESRMIVELGWVLVVVLATKVNEPPESLEPAGTPDTVLKRLSIAVKRSR